jgi:hypothetical protein
VDLHAKRQEVTTNRNNNNVHELDYYNRSVHLNFYMPDVGTAISLTAPSVDVDLPRLSLELEFLISGYGCFGDGRGTHLGVKE